MIVDFHTHIYPPDVIAERESISSREPVFAQLYGSPEAQLATAEDLLQSMDAAGVDVSAALGFAWQDPTLGRLHNDYLLGAATESSGRIVPFCTLPLAAGPEAIEAEMRRCLAAGAPGFGELRPGNLDCDLLGEPGQTLGGVAAESGALLLFHTSEPVGHAYPGKEGLEVVALYRFILANPGARIVAAHWGGGLPFYAMMPEVREAFANTWFDTAASSLLYDSSVFKLAPALTGAGKVLFGSDFPLLGQGRSRRRIEEAELPQADKDLILGGNAAALLGLA